MQAITFLLSSSTGARLEKGIRASLWFMTRLEPESGKPELAEATLDLELVMGLLGSKQEVLLYQAGTDSLDPTLGAFALLV